MASQQSSIEPDAADGQHFVAFGVAIALFALAFAAFYPCLKNEFITFDDGLYITGNHHVQEGFTWQNMIWAFRTLDGGIWHPLTWLSIMLDCRLYGLNPAGHHLTNVLLHAASTALLFLALRKMTCAIWPSAFVAAAFAVHPLHVESVAWAAERKDVLSAFFFVGALLAYASYASQRDVRKEVASIEFSVFREKWFYYGLALAMFVLGMMGKSMVITLPIILLSLDWWPLQRLTKKSARSLIIEKLPYFAVGLLVGIVTLHGQKELGALITADDLPFSKRLANAIISYVFYLIQTFWPARLAIYYPYPRSIPFWTVIACVIFLLVVSALAFRARRRCPFLAVGWLWYLVTLLPVIGLLQVGSQAHADRYVYVPLVGIFILLAWTAREFSLRLRRPLRVFVPAAMAALAACTAITHIQVSYWKDSESLFRHALAVTRENRIAHDNLGTALLRRGQVDEAIGHFREALRLKPDDPEELNNLSLVLMKQGQIEEAISMLQKASQLKPGDASVHYSLGLAFGREEKLPEAAEQFGEAIKLNPRHAEAHCGLGIILMRAHRFNEAIETFRTAIRLNPRYPEAYYQLGMVQAAQGQLEAAASNLSVAIQIKPGYLDAHRNLGITLGRQGKLDKAVAEFRQVLQINPENAEAHCDLGIALMRQNRTEEGIREFRNAVGLAPASAEAHANLGAALARKGEMEEGISHLREALRLRPDYPAARENLRAALESK